MEDRNEMEKMDEVLLPGFRFHPTDEELVTFYLRKKIQQKPLAVELIRQLDIYKFDPWDLPKMAASTGDKEWYFYCPRGRKYRNSLRPNRVTVAGFWKATGTDRPIYSSEGTKCIGLKKSLVFYRGRAAKGTKTDWMMHEFRLPSLNNNIKALPSFGNNIDQNDSWAICKIFQKTTSLAQRELNHSVTHPLPCDNFAIPNTQSVDAKNQNCYPVLDFASYSSSSVQINFAHKVYGGDDVQKDTENTKLVQLEETESLGNGEEDAEAMKSSSTLYGTNDQWQTTESVEEFPFNFSWESPSCPSVDTTMSWTERNSYNSFD